MSLKHLKKVTIILLSITFNWSCTSYKKVPYFQDLEKNNTLNQQIKNHSPLTIQEGDIVEILVSSSNPEADFVFNYDLNLGLTKENLGINGVEGRDAKTTISDHRVDIGGNINLPVLGRLKVAGLNTQELIEELELKLQNFFLKPIVTVRLINFKISVLGDVLKPGIFNVLDEKITLLQGLALAGDLNVTGVRQNVLLIREVSGVRDYVHVDLTSKELFTSPYYYLKNNDVLYVQPNRVKATTDNKVIEKASLLLSALSIIAYLIRFK